MPVRMQDNARVEEGERAVNRWTATRRMEAANILLCMRTTTPDEDCDGEDKKCSISAAAAQHTESNTLEYSSPAKSFTAWMTL